MDSGRGGGSGTKKGGRMYCAFDGNGDLGPTEIRLLCGQIKLNVFLPEATEAHEAI